MGGSKPQTVTQTNTPWKVQTPYYTDLYKRGASALDQTNGQWYQGNTYAGPNQNQLDANAAAAAASGSMGTGVEDLRNMAQSQLRGDWLNPETNPFIAQTAQAALKPVQQAFDANKLAMNDMAISQGAYGGARQDLQQNRLMDDFTNTAGNLTNDIYYKNYANERGIMQNSADLLDQANRLSLAGPTALAAAGSQAQGWDQAALDDAQARWTRQQQAPWQGLGEMSNLLSSGGFGTSTQVTEAAKQNPILGILQGLMGGASTGASLASGIGNVAAGAGIGAFAPWMLPFAALGGLAGAL
jgi:hypothetical protein